MYLWAFVWDEEIQLQKKGLLLKSRRWAACADQTHGKSLDAISSLQQSSWGSTVLHLAGKDSKLRRGNFNCDRGIHLNIKSLSWERWNLISLFSFLFPIYFFLIFFSWEWFSSSLLADQKTVKYLEHFSFIPKGHAIAKGILLLWCVTFLCLLFSSNCDVDHIKFFNFLF